MRLEQPHSSYMKTPFGLPRLLGWTGRCAVALTALTFCASSFADSEKNVVVSKEKVTRAQVARHIAPKRQVYIILTGSAIPQPIDRVAGLIATTTIPMTTIGNKFGE